MKELKVVGQSVERLDAKAKVTGTAEFVFDMVLQGMLWGKILRSPFPHALIKYIDYSEAEQLPGVYAVITGTELGDRLHGPGLWDEPILAKDRVRYVGEGVAAVAAESEETASAALKLIKVEYEPLPAVFDVEEAFRENSPVVVHPDLPSYYSSPHMKPNFVEGRPNVYHSHVIASGNIEAGFKEADLVIEDKYTLGRIQHCQMEPHAAIVKIEANGDVNLWASTSTIHPTKNLFANAFCLEPSRVRIYAPNVGGGFGGKQNITAAGVAYGLARKSGRPVKVAFTREEVFIGAQTRHPAVIYIKDGIKKDGTIVAREITLLQNGGAYAENGYLTTRNACFGAVGTYKIPNLKISSYGVYTNEPVAGAFRGFGNTQVQWAIESQMDVIAEKLRLDPVEIRLKNILDEGDINPAGEVMHSVGIKECIDRVVTAMQQKLKNRVENIVTTFGTKSSQDIPSFYKRGIGFAICNKYSLAPTASSAIVKVYEDGRVEARIGTDEVGQGLRTVIGQIVAEEFGLDMKDVQVISGDTGLCPYDEGSVSSRSTYNTGNAVRLACQDAKRQVLERASKLMQVNPDELEVSGKKVFIKGNSHISLDIRELFILNKLAYGAYLPEAGEFIGKATWIQGIEEGGSGINTGKRLTAFYTHGAQAVEVLVDTETGHIKIENIWSAFDTGKAINPALCEAQIEGGIGMGIGSTLFEKMVVVNGKTLNPSFTDYILPTAMDLPNLDNVHTYLVEALHKDGPYGAKGLGEATMIPTAPAIANAVYNALGIRIKDLPLEPEMILEAISTKTQ